VNDRLESERVAALVVEDVDFEGSAVTRVKAVVNAMSELQRAGLRMVLIDGFRTEVTVRRVEGRRRRWWRSRERKER
jgi:hypothetical protein